MHKNTTLVLVENVENLGIVGDVVKVRLGYARNFLLPRGLADVPSDELLQSLQAKREEAKKQLEALRQAQKEMTTKLEGYELTLTRSCNDQGILYGSVTQQDIANALNEAGFTVKPRDVRLPHAIKRLDTYEVAIKFDAELETAIKLWVVPDRELPKTNAELEQEAEVEKAAAEDAAAQAEAPAAEPAAQ